ncbi:MAG: hypothetical protein H7A24_17340 [Leptospiraceae bacterium]|nr:hypothetical protein [Leptospiraceae bacterium]MCP5513657.1 hypothetical protein [Leptospiraceae bacterium]
MTNNTQVLNQIIQIIDQKATAYKKNKKTMNRTALESEKVLITNTIKDAIQLAESIKPVPASIISDLKALMKQL